MSHHLNALAALRKARKSLNDAIEELAAAEYPLEGDMREAIVHLRRKVNETHTDVESLEGEAEHLADRIDDQPWSE